MCRLAVVRPLCELGGGPGGDGGDGGGYLLPGAGSDPREAVALLYSFGTNYLGLELTERADLTPYEDAAAVASWGGEAVAWAVGAGLLSSSDADLMLLSPDESATGPRWPVLLQNFAEKYL